MKTKLNKKSLAASLATILISACTFLGISLPASQNANASCDVKKDGKTVFKCVGDEGNCKEELRKTKFLQLILGNGEISIECSGQKVKIEDSGNDERNDDFVTINP